MPPDDVPRAAGFPVDLGCGAVFGGVEGDESVAAVVEAEGDELLGEVARAHVVTQRVVGARGAVAHLQDPLAQPAMGDNVRRENPKRLLIVQDGPSMLQQCQSGQI